jgi:lipoprotein-releasing system ATP-binding protein
MRKFYLKADHIFKSYTQAGTSVRVLHDVCVTFEKGASYAITGASGSGKSTLIHLLAGLDRPTSGSILFDKQNIALFTEDQKSAFLSTGIGLVFQYPYLIKELNVLENVMLKGLIAGDTKQKSLEMAKDLLEWVGLDQKVNAYPGQLSGGQQQRVALARALMNKPAFLLADEPTGNLDLKTGTAIIDLILNLQKEWGMGIIISSHDAYVAQKMNTVYELKEGKLIF